ncbi:unnamed protein product, partial [Rotaria magnacalcarata]
MTTVSLITGALIPSVSL